MRPLSAHNLLRVWEQGQHQHPWERALMMLAVNSPEMTWHELAALPVGQRDARLLSLREHTFGPRLTGVSLCPACQGRLEFTVAVADIQIASPSLYPQDQRETGENQANLSLSVAGYAVHFRLPNSLDLSALAGGADVDATRLRLLERCLLGAEHDGEEIAADGLPADVVDAVVARMAQADPQGDVQLSLSCPGCGHHWQAMFDIVSFFWSEINAWVVRVLHEVHTLASAYGWRESDILTMSPRRRQAYLEMVSG
jgi:hypothetical protein